MPCSKLHYFTATLADDEGNTSLHFAAKTGHVGIIDLLLLKIGAGHQEVCIIY